MLAGDMTKHYCCDSKYENIIFELGRRGWSLLPESDSVPSTCSLLWKNLSKIGWGGIFDRYVNHIRGSQHMSNKSYLAYHLHGSEISRILPPSWSSSFQDLSSLITMVSSDELANLIESISTGEIERNKIVSQHRLHSNILAELHKVGGDDIWRNSEVYRKHIHLIGVLGRLIDVESADSRDYIVALGEIQTSQSSRGLWIIKPVAQACGRDISVVRGMEAVLDAVAAMNFQCVVQKYIERPLLVRNKRKFDIRQWALITSVNPLVIYGFSQCYLRLSGRPYSLDEDSLPDSQVHLCNHTVNSAFEDEKVSSGSTDGREDSSFSSYTMMTQLEFEKVLEVTHNQYNRCPPPPPAGDSSLDTPISLHDDEGGSSVFQSVILPQIRSVSVSAVEACREKFTKVGRGFEWLGLDLMVTEALEVRLLEVNISPDTSSSTVVTSRLVEAATRDLFDLVLEDRAVDSPSHAVAAAERAHSSGSVRWDRRLGVAGEGAQLISRQEVLAIDSSHEKPKYVASDQLLWQLWYVGKRETKSELDRLGTKKIDKLGVPLQLTTSSSATIHFSSAAQQENLRLVSVVRDIVHGESIASRGEGEVTEEKAIAVATEENESDDEM